MKHFLYLSFATVLSAYSAAAQVEPEIDSLRKAAASTSDLKVRVSLYQHIVYQWAEADFDSAFYYASRMQQDAVSSGDPQLAFKSLVAFGVTYDYHGETDSARHYYQLAKATAASNNDSSSVAVANFNLATLEYAAGNYLAAIEAYLEAEKLFVSLNNERNLSRIYNNLGQVYATTGQVEPAIKAYELSLQLKKKLKDVKGSLNTLTNLAIVHMNNRNYEASERASLEVLSIAKEHSDSLAYRNELVNMAENYAAQGNEEEVIRYLEEARPLVKPDDPAQLKGSYWSTKATYHLNRHEYAEALRSVNKIEELTAQSSKLNVTYLRLKALCFEGLGDYRSAMAFQKRYMVENDRQLSEEVQKKAREFEIMYETEKKELQIAALELDRKETALISTRREQQRNLFIVVTLALLLVAGLIYRQYDQKRKSNKRLEIALADREVLLREIHHRVKNNLQVISSLLHLQSRKVKDASALDAVTEGRNRVRSMSMIHEQLYQRDNLAGINISHYIESLAGSLARSYGVDEEKIHFVVSAEPLHLDVDTAIPLGLILNELLSNALKYAFPEDRAGEIRITLVKKDQKLILSVSDNGVGLNGTKGEGGNFGTELVGLLAEKLKASVSTENSGGVAVRLEIEKFKII